MIRRTDPMSHGLGYDDLFSSVDVEALAGGLGIEALAVERVPL